jgi:membrane protein DedA with SNARE-associated domain
VSAISAAGYPGVAALMAVESACIPLPSEIIMPFAGYLVSQGRLNLFLVATAGAVGCNIGSTIAYGIGRYGGRAVVLRWGRYLLFDARELDRMDHFFDRFGVAAVLVGRLLPIVRTFISLPAGISRMGFARFQIYTFIGSWPWCWRWRMPACCSARSGIRIRPSKKRFSGSTGWPRVCSSCRLPCIFTAAGG